jgi:outer membrane protein OmpA-like peptidoglycan-associated protein
MKKFLLFFGVILISCNFIYSLKLEFKNEVGRKYRFKNWNKQEIFRNGVFYRRIESLNKATIEILAVTNDSGFYQGKYYYYEKNPQLNEPFELKTIYESKFLKDKYGRMKVSPDILMPTLRSVPTFPPDDISPGFSWKAPGEEIHEGILVRENIIITPINVNYVYLGNEIIEGREYAKILIDYHLIDYPQNDPDILSFTGFSHSVYYWDISNSSPAFYNEEYSFMFTIRNGETVLYRGTTEGKMDEVIDLIPEKKEELIAEISNKMDITTGKDVSISNVIDGIIVNLGNILFDFNKYNLKKEYEKKLDALAEVLRKYPSIDIIISGHTDNIGTEKYNQALSENRAKTVAEYLMRKGVAQSRISYIGFGSRFPVADNSTEEGRQKNRRVEVKLITKE